jgi:hypothetical protein
MLDRPAAIRAAREVLESSPVVEGVNDDQPIVDLAKLVDAILAAANPDALIVPAYDEQLAQSARYRLEQDPEGGRGAHLALMARPNAVAVGVTAGAENVLVAGLVGTDIAWHTGLAWCSAAMESKRLHEGDR